MTSPVPWSRKNAKGIFKAGKDATKFFFYAKGSAGELRTQIYIGMEIGYIHKQTGLSWIQEAKEISKMLSGLIKVRTP